MRYPRVIVIKSGNKVADYWNHRGGRFFDQPMARAFDDLAANVGRDEFRLLYQECAAGLLTRQDQHGHGEPRTCQPRKVLRVALEISKILKACPHRARLRIRPGVKSAIGLRNGPFTIRGEVVPEVFEVNAFATLHQRQRDLSVEMEVPQVA